MNIALSKTQTMSSREIAELTGKAHKEVTRDIENVLSQAEIDERNFAHIYKDAKNRSYREYRLLEIAKIWGEKNGQV
jgi:phage regulator Rha-like protein